MVGQCIHRRTWSAQVGCAGREEGVCAGDIDELCCRVKTLTLRRPRKCTGNCGAQYDAEIEKHCEDVRHAGTRIAGRAVL